MAGSGSYALNFHHHQPPNSHQPSTGFYSGGTTTAPEYLSSYVNPSHDPNLYRGVQVGATSTHGQYSTTSNITKTASATTLGPQPPPPPPTFRAPAHKNSHHLHSIPPREKSTRILIIDHMLWAHGAFHLFSARCIGGSVRSSGGQGVTSLHSLRVHHSTEPFSIYPALPKFSTCTA